MGLAWKQTKHEDLLVDDGEMNTKLSFELGELRQRINKFCNRSSADTHMNFVQIADFDWLPWQPKG